MRIAVCRPQVPFSSGGAEVFSDALVEQLRERGHDAEIVSVPFKWYPGARVLTQAFLWRMLDLSETDGRPIDMVVATKFPSYVVRHPEKRVWLVHQFRQAYELDRTDLGQFGEAAEDRALRRQVQELDRVSLREATRLFATSHNVAGRLERSTGLVAEVLPHPAQELDYRNDGHGDFILSVNRLDRAKRVDLLIEAAALERSLSVVVVGEGPDRAAARVTCARTGSRGPRPAHRARRCGRSGHALRNLLRVLLRTDRRGLRARPLRVVPLRQARDHIDRCGRAARRGPRRLDGACGRPECRGDRRRSRVAARPSGRSCGVRPGGPRRRSRGHVGARDRQAAVVKVALFSPMPPERSGIADYSSLLLPALRTRCDVVAVKRGRKRPPRGTDLCVYHIGNNPDAHGWIVEALRRTPGVVVMHDFVLHHLVAGLTIGRRDGHGYLDAMEREGGVVGRLLGHAVLDKRIPPLWENRPEDFHLAGEVLDLASGLIVHSRHVQGRARAAGYARPIWVVPHPTFPVPEISEAVVDGEPLVGTFGNVNASKRIPQLLEAFARTRGRHEAIGLLLVGASSPGFDLDRRLQRLGLDGAGLVREGFVGERRLWELMAAADIHVNLRSPTMGETSGTAIRALSLGKPLIVSDVGWFSELPADVALKIPVDEREVDTLAAALELLATQPDLRRAMGAAALGLARREHGLERVADLYVAAFEQAAGGAAVSDAVLGEVSRAAADVGIEPGSAEAREIAARLGEVELGG